jgi:hypothetical protein
LDFVEEEFDLNQAYMKLVEKFNRDSIYSRVDIQSLLMQLANNDQMIDEIIDDYNARTLDYNKYISIFPNFYFAKENRIVKAKYFTIKYGYKNDDPVIKSKELPEWAEGIDTSL